MAHHISSANAPSPKRNLTPSVVLRVAMQTPLPGDKSDVGADKQSLRSQAKPLPSLKKGASDTISLDSSKSYPGILAHEPALSSPPKPVTAMNAAHFGEQVAKLAQETKTARNIMPMIVRGGVIASLGVFLFGHLAPLAVLGIMMGAVLGGYAIAKFLQLRHAKHYAAMGENNPVAQLRRDMISMPHEISAEDRAKAQSIIDFVEKGAVFGNGMLKTFREPWQGIRKRFSSQKNVGPAIKQPMGAAADDNASLASPRSEADEIKHAYLSGLNK